MAPLHFYRPKKTRKRAWWPVGAWGILLLLLLLAPNDVLGRMVTIGPFTSTLGHVLGFCVLGYLVYWAIYQDEKLRLGPADTFTLAFFLLAISSIATELLQAFSPRKKLWLGRCSYQLGGIICRKFYFSGQILGIRMVACFTK